MQLLFWSGRSFEEPELKPEGKFKAAELRITDAAQIKPRDLKRWLRKARTIQWDYKNLVKRRGVLEKLGDWWRRARSRRRTLAIFFAGRARRGRSSREGIFGTCGVQRGDDRRPAGSGALAVVTKSGAFADSAW